MADKTKAKYRTAVNMYMGYCLVEAADPRDLVEDQFMGFMLYMVECRGTVPRTGRQYVGDICAMLVKQGMQDPQIENMKALKALLQRLKVMYPNNPRKRLPLVQQDYVRMWDVLDTSSIPGARFKALILCMWQTVSRFDDLRNVKRSEVLQDGDQNFVLTIAKHKMSYASNRFTEKLVAWPAQPETMAAISLSAALALRRYLELDPTRPTQDSKAEYLFRNADGTPLDYQFMLNQLRRVLAAMGYDPMDFGLHSPRIGGGTCALNSSDGNEFVTKQMGFWAGDSVRLYCRPTKNLIVDIQRAMAIALNTAVFNM
jgi:integrase